jgi:hypothetical protein
MMMITTAAAVTGKKGAREYLEKTKKGRRRANELTQI